MIKNNEDIYNIFDIFLRILTKIIDLFQNKMKKLAQKAQLNPWHQLHVQQLIPTSPHLKQACLLSAHSRPDTIKFIPQLIVNLKKLQEKHRNRMLVIY